MPYDKQAVARRLKSLRADKGWDQQKLADEIGVDKSTIAHYELGDTCMGLDKAYAITEAFGCTIDRLVCRER